jgi:hypothetical protein
MSEWNVSGDGMTIEPRQRRSPLRWLDDYRLRIAVVIGVVEAAVAYFQGIRFLWLFALLAVFGYLWVRRHVHGGPRRALWVVAMSQAVAGLVVPAVFGLFFIAAVVGVLLLLIMALVLLGDLRRR